jgi:hypothetical protein
MSLFGRAGSAVRDEGVDQHAPSPHSASDSSVDGHDVPHGASGDDQSLGHSMNSDEFQTASGSQFPE